MDRSGDRESDVCTYECQKQTTHTCTRGSYGFNASGTWMAGNRYLIPWGQASVHSAVDKLASPKRGGNHAVPYPRGWRVRGPCRWRSPSSTISQTGGGDLGETGSLGVRLESNHPTRLLHKNDIIFHEGGRVVFITELFQPSKL